MIATTRRVRPIARRVEHVMGMPISLALRGRHAGDVTGDAAWNDALTLLRRADQTFSTYRTDSEVSQINRGEIGSGDWSADVHEVLAIAEQGRLQSGGAFDVWRTGPDGKPMLDPSGIVKGWAVQRASAALEDLTDTDFCLSAGGDMVCRTRDADALPWRIGVEDPGDPCGIVAVIPVHNGGVATSGLVHRGAHIVDPRTGCTPDHLASVTVVADDLIWADIDATAAFVQGLDALTWLATRPGRTGVLVHPDGRTELFDVAD